MEKCISCSGNLQKIGSSNGFEIYQCGVCGLGKTFGTRIDYNDYHRDDVYIKEDPQFKNIFNKRVNLILKFKKKGSVLDIGSSTGAMLSIFKEKGWDVQGIEPSKVSSQDAQKKGIPTINSFFEKTKLANGEYDVVVANHVLEHVSDLGSFIKKTNNVLKNDGLFLIDVPNFASLSAKMSGTNWQYLLPQEHVWHFTPRSLKNLLEKEGFKVVYQETHSGIWGYGNPLQELVQSLFGFKKRFFTNLVSAIPAWFISKLDLGTGLTIIAKK